MDYRERKYYLAHIDYFSYDMRLRYFKIMTPSLIVRPPNDYYYRMGKSLGFQYPNMVLSCRIEDSDCLEYELRKAERRDSCSMWIEINKDNIGQ